MRWPVYSARLASPPPLSKVLARLPHIKRLIVVADRGPLSLDSLEELTKIALPSQQPLEFILAVPGRRLVVAHHPQRAAEQSQLRNARIATLQEQAQVWAGRLGRAGRGPTSQRVKGTGRACRFG